MTQTDYMLPAHIMTEPGAQCDNMSHHSIQQLFSAVLKDAEEKRATAVSHSNDAMQAAANHEASMPTFKLVYCSAGTVKIDGADLARLTQRALVQIQAVLMPYQGSASHHDL